MTTKSEHIQMKLSGIHTAADRRAAAAVLRGVDGVRAVSVKQDTATLSYNPDKTTVSAVTTALAQQGYHLI